MTGFRPSFERLCIVKDIFVGTCFERNKEQIRVECVYGYILVM